MEHTKIKVYPYIYRNNKGNPKVWVNIVYQLKRKLELR